MSEVSAARAASSHDPMLMLSQFIDDLRRTGDMGLVAERPQITGSRRFDVRIAATVEALCHEMGVEPPGWTDEGCRFLSEPMYAYGTRDPEARAYFEETSLPEFSRRGLYLGDNVISRV